MRSYGQLWKIITAEENILGGWLTFRRHHSTEAPVREFESGLKRHLAELHRRLVSGAWRPHRYYQFRITDPKPRTISCAPVCDRVVHHALCNVIAPLMERRFIDRSYACRKGKGAHLACQKARELCGEYPYYLKMDVRHYFDSIDHGILLGLLRKLFREKEVTSLCETIIRHPLPGQVPGKGLPIGNLTSQWFANLYLDELDHRMTERFGCGRAYLRYMDDILIFVRTKEDAWNLRTEIAEWLGRERLLSVKEEATRVGPVSEGVPFLGLRIFSGTWRYQRSRFLRTRSSCRRHYRAFAAGLEDEERLQMTSRSMEGANRWYGFKGVLASVEAATPERRVTGETSYNSGENRVKRGGSWNNNAENCRPSNRNNNNADNDNNNGFRLSSTCREQSDEAQGKSHPARPALRDEGGFVEVILQAETNMPGRIGEVSTCAQTPRRPLSACSKVMQKEKR